MRMSLLGYLTFSLLAILSVIAFIANPEPRTLLTMVPMLLALLLIPMLLTEMNRRAMAKVDTRGVRQYRISDLMRLEVGEQVRVEGEVQRISFRWMNRPHLELTDGAASTKVILFTAPRENIKVGDRVEAIGALARMLSREKKIWGVTVHKVPKRTQSKR